MDKLDCAFADALRAHGHLVCRPGKGGASAIRAADTLLAATADHAGAAAAEAARLLDPASRGELASLRAARRGASIESSGAGGVCMGLAMAALINGDEAELRRWRDAVGERAATAAAGREVERGAGALALNEAEAARGEGTATRSMPPSSGPHTRLHVARLP